jgi:glycosyltransferase involved in cell wall biosynthesis
VSRITVGLPVYNGSDYLATAIQSILAQRYGDFELFISDNASVDATEDICRHYAAKDRRIRYVRRPYNVGAAANFNLLVMESESRYFKWAAHDDVLAPGFLEAAVRILDRDPAIVLASPASALIDETGELLPYSPERGGVIDRAGVWWPRLPEKNDGLTARDPVVRFEALMLKMVMCVEIFGLMRRSALVRTSLLRPFSGGDKVLLAQMTLLGPFWLGQDVLLLRRCHAKQFSATASGTYRAAWFSGRRDTILEQQIKLLLAYCQTVRKAEMDLWQKASCFRAIARRALFRGHQLRRLTGVLVARDHLPPTDVEHGKRLAKLVRYLDLDNHAWFRAWKVFGETKFHKRRLPRGLMPVGDGLRVRERAAEDGRVARVAADGRDPSEGRATPERFYSFKQDAAWLGIFRDWDVRRGFHDQLCRSVERLLSADSAARIAAIVGRGGTGKSVALRRLGVELAAAGREVWWVEDQRPALDFGLSKLVAPNPRRRRLILLDEVHRLENSQVRQLQELLARAPGVALVVAGREMPAELRTHLKAGESLFATDEAADQFAILAKIGQVLPDWAEAARALASEPMRQAPLVQLLFVLPRAATSVPRNLEELELQFLNMVAQEILRVKDVHPGLAQALLFAAMVRSSGYDLSWPSMIALADYYEPRTSSLSLLDANDRQQPLAESLISHDPIHDTIVFHHDELAEGVVEAGLHGSFEPWVTFGDAWLNVALARLVQVGSDHSRTLALSGLTRMFPDLLTRDEILTAMKTSGDDHALRGAVR